MQNSKLQGCIQSNSWADTKLECLFCSNQWIMIGELDLTYRKGIWCPWCGSLLTDFIYNPPKESLNAPSVR
jgi:transcription elongation factor Elf1